MRFFTLLCGLMCCYTVLASATSVLLDAEIVDNAMDDLLEDIRFKRGAKDRKGKKDKQGAGVLPTANMCFTCSNTNNPIDCHTQKKCNPKNDKNPEICSLTFTIDNNNDTVTYQEFGCQSAKKCKQGADTIRCSVNNKVKPPVTICSGCCTGDLCNRKAKFQPDDKMYGPEMPVGECYRKGKRGTGECVTRAQAECLNGKWCPGGSGLYHLRKTSIIPCDICPGDLVPDDADNIIQAAGTNVFLVGSSSKSSSKRKSGSSGSRKSSSRESRPEIIPRFYGNCGQWSSWNSCDVLKCTNKRYRKCPKACDGNEFTSRRWRGQYGAKSRQRYYKKSGSGSSRRKRTATAPWWYATQWIRRKSSESERRDSSAGSRESSSSRRSSGWQSSAEHECFYTQSQSRRCPTGCTGPTPTEWSRWGPCDTIDCKSRRVRYFPKLCDDPRLRDRSPASSPESDFTNDKDSEEDCDRSGRGSSKGYGSGSSKYKSKCSKSGSGSSKRSGSGSGSSKTKSSKSKSSKSKSSSGSSAASASSEEIRSRPDFNLPSGYRAPPYVCWDRELDTRDCSPGSCRPPPCEGWGQWSRCSSTTCERQRRQRCPINCQFGGSPDGNLPGDIIKPIPPFANRYPDESRFDITSEEEAISSSERNSRSSRKSSKSSGSSSKKDRSSSMRKGSSKSSGSGSSGSSQNKDSSGNSARARYFFNNRLRQLRWPVAVDNKFDGIDDRDFERGTPTSPRQCWSIRIETESCTDKCIGNGFSNWVAISQCSASCGGGKRRERRTCSNPTDGPRQCQATEERLVACNTNPCIIERKCPYRMPPLNGRFSGGSSQPDSQNEYSVGNFVRFECNPCYTIATMPGSSTPMADSALCREDGSWSNPVPRCDPLRCTPIPAPANGQRNPRFGNNECNDIVDYSCNPGFEEQGTRVRRIQCIQVGNGAEWDKDPLTCGAKCNMRMPPINGRVDDANSDQADNQQQFSPGDVVIYECNPCYKIRTVGSQPEFIVKRTECQEGGRWDKPVPTCEPLQCPIVPVGEGVIQLGSNNNCGESISYRCEQGYIPSGGQQTVTCTPRGNLPPSWSGTPLTCTRPECPNPMPFAPENGRREPVGTRPGQTSPEPYTPGDRIYYDCDRCYNIRDANGNSDKKFILCENTKQWDDPVPTCERVTCQPPPQRPRNGGIQNPSGDCGSTTTYTCNECYRPVGQTRRTCGPDGNFVPQAEPTCQLQQCQRVQSLANGRIVFQNTDCGGQIQFLCNDGFTLIGSERLECEDDGRNVKWSGSVPTCSAPQCPEPMPFVPTNGRRAGNFNPPYDVRDRIVYACNDCYEIDREDRLGRKDPDIECQNDGTWDDPVPGCKRKECLPAPSAPANGNVSPSNAECGRSVTYTCNECYRLAGGSPTRECTNNGWSPLRQPTCRVITCPTPPAPQNGRIVRQTVNCGQEIEFACFNGFDLVGSKTLTCRDTGGPIGEWDGDVPECQAGVCEEPMPFAPVNGRRDNRPGKTDDPPYTPFEKISYECNSCYTIARNRFNIVDKDIMCLTGLEWDGPVPTCEKKVCDDIFPPTNGEITKRDIECGGETVYGCDSCYRLTGANPRQCTDNGWATPPPQCQQLFCRVLRPPTNGRITGLTSCGSEVEFTCNDGFTLVGRQSLRCTPTGSGEVDWNGQPPTCQSSGCPIPMNSPPVNGAVVQRPNSGPPYSVGQVFKFECNECFRIARNRFGQRIDQIRCQANGEWDNPAPTCEQLRCEDIRFIQNGIVTEIDRLCRTNTSPDKQGKAFYECEIVDGVQYVLQPNRPNVCTEGPNKIADWDRKRECVPRLTDLECTPPANSPPVNGRFVSGRPQSSYAVGIILRYGCNACYRIFASGRNDRDDDIACQEVIKPGEVLKTADWDSPTPVCNRLRCSAITAPTSGRRIPFSGSEQCGDEIRFECNDGFNPEGVDRIRCTQTGPFKAEWDNKPLICKKVEIKFCEAPLPFAPQNGRRVAGSASQPYEPGDVIRYACNRCYKLSSSGPLGGGGIDDDIECLNSGEWDGVVPACEKLQCSAVTPPENGFIVSADRECGGKTRFACKEGYTLSGDAEITCTESGNYDNNPPTCSMEFGICRASGDPHYKTFDGAAIHFQCACLYLLSGSKPGPWNQWKILVQNEYLKGNFIGSWTRYVEIQYNNLEIRLLQGALGKSKDPVNSFDDPVAGGFNVQVDGLRVEPSTRLQNGDIDIYLKGLFVCVEIKPLNLKVKWDGSARALVVLGNFWRNKVEGICQNFNGDPSDDLTLRNGQSVAGQDNPGTQIGNSYQVNSQDECKACDLDDIPTCIDQDTVFRKCSILGDITGVFGQCIRALSDADKQYYLESCQMDLCVDPSVFCDILEDFGAFCASESGTVRGWRSQTNCPFPSCPFPSEYKEDGLSCQNSCVEPNAEDSCPPGEAPVEGCFCPPFFVLSGTDCVPFPFGCGCTDENGIFRPRGSRWLNDDCTIMNMCLGTGSVNTRPWQCRNGQLCTLVDGANQCTCPAGFTKAIDGSCTPNDICKTRPCLNGGTCIPDGSEAGFACRCPTNNPGKRCEGTNGGWCPGLQAVFCDPCAESSTNLFVRTCLCKRPVSPGLPCSGDFVYEEPCTGICRPCFPNPCENGGTCIENGKLFQCRCPSGFSGPRCRRTQSQCSSAPCKNGGSCSETVDPLTGRPDFFCSCVNPFTGKDCSENPCKGFDCVKNQGACVINNGVAFCQCFLNQYGQRYYGRLCESINGGYCPPRLGQCDATCGGGNIPIIKECNCPKPVGSGQICPNGQQEIRTFPCNNQPCPIIQCGDGDAMLICPTGTAIDVMFVEYGKGVDDLCGRIQRGCSARDALNTLNKYCNLDKGAQSCSVPLRGRDEIFYPDGVPRGCEQGRRRLVIRYHCTSNFRPGK
ncbi:unnamed protein product [Owenia fusiformis]|uniref:Uncharacterized protein n=1 Tax=Owenia fusiformis TaxID=6347 RepID=A0A8S4NP96_OWEFU|nr:unnamed protein product [Owenia fusiformis]